MKLDLNPEVEASLLAQAHARGLSLEAYLDQVLQTATADDIYVEKHRDVWTVKKSHTDRASDILPSQKEAIERARDVSSTSGRVRDRASRPAGRKSLAQLFAESPFKGLGLDFERNPDTGRPVKL